MFHQPNYSDPSKHISTSSSIYSPEESPQSHQGSSSSSNSRSPSSVDHHHTDNISYHRSYEDLESTNDYDDEEEEEAVRYSSRLPTEPSNHTMLSYKTARSGAYSFEDSSDDDEGNYTPNHDDSGLRTTPSFSSINDSILHESSRNTTIGEDNDETPLINTRDRYADETPIVNSNGFIDELNNNEEILFQNQQSQQLQLGQLEEEDPSSSALPKRKLSKQFKRLSVALQNTRASGDSYQFRNAFQSNIEQANRHASQESANLLRRKSTYYAKLEEKPSQLQDKRAKEKFGEDAEHMVNDKEHHLETSSVSTRASSIHSSDMSISGSEHDDSSLHRKPSIASSNHFVFGNEFPSSYNLGGSKIKDDIPVRKDLLVSDASKGDLAEQERLQSYNNSTAMLEKGGLNIVYKETEKESTTKDRKKSRTPPEEDEDDLSEFFIRALHSFDSSTLQSESDASICLSFEKNDIAFLHNIDESGWGEVTLIDTLQTGWIPMNYFALVISNDESDTEEEEEDSDELEGRIPNSQYLKPLFHSCGQFLSNPLSHRNRKDKYTFSIRVINSIRDGVRLLLQQTDCLSRSNEIVTKRPVVRRSRKSLLADWYNLMVKANEFKGTSNYSKIEILTLMVYQVSSKALSFLEVWSAESKQIVTHDNDKRLYDDLNNYPLLSKPPLAKQRITEINGILNSYLGLIIGRLDLIEHNQVGCDMLETLAHQIILLLRELLFISRTGSDFSSEKPKDLDSSLDGLLSLVSELVASVKNLVVKTINETDDDRVHNFGSPQLNGARDYYYTMEGGELIQIATRMIRAINSTISSIRKLLEVTGDFKLTSGRSYPDYNKMRIEPHEFIKMCSKGITTNSELLPPAPTGTGVKAYKANRYSMVRAGKTGNLGFTEGGAQFLLSLNSDLDNSSPFTMSAPEFEPFKSEEGGDNSNRTTDINNELLVDNDGHLLGGSFRALVYTLTNEDTPPEYFFVSAFFICFRSFGNGIELIEELITRFEVGTHSSDINTDLRLKKRRKLIVQMFQLWMESYWNYEADYNLLTTLINFFNEGMSAYLPLDAIKLIEVGARLSSRPLVENRLKRFKPTKQLVDRSITLIKATRNETATTSDMSRFSMVDGYELSKINTNSTTSTSSMNSTSLPLPLGAGTSNSSLLTGSQIQTIEKINLTYRAILGNSWCSQKYISSSKYIPLDLQILMPNFFIICDQSWVLSNYRPNLLDFNGLEIAKQLTLLESHIFCSIRPDELLNQNYTTKRAHLKLAPNVRLSLLFTNCLSGYVLESILQPNIPHKARVSTIKTWLKVAISCLYLRNFNSLAAIITALESHLITRLNSIWVDLQGKYQELYDYLISIIHPEKNYHVYRNKLRNFLMTKDFNVPIVPYFSLFLQDLTFVTDGNPNFRKANTFLNQKLINIDKYLKITKVIADIECLQVPYDSSSGRNPSTVAEGFGKELEDIDYNIASVHPLQELILLELWKICQLNKTEEDRAWKLSCAIQPR